jgi:hypothetical protein
MLIIRDSQLAPFEKIALRQFEDDMLAHVQAYFAAHLHMTGAEGIRKTIRLAGAQAGPYGAASRRNVCLYLNTMLILGSHFDTDPQYPWAPAILQDTSAPPNRRMDRLADTAADVLEAINGTGHIRLIRVLKELTGNAAAVHSRLKELPAAERLSFFAGFFPARYDTVGPAALEQWAQSGSTAAAAYGFRTEGEINVYLLFAFLLGSGFDRDPQFPWAATVLQQRAPKAEALFDAGVRALTIFLSPQNQQPDVPE